MWLLLRAASLTPAVGKGFDWQPGRHARVILRGSIDTQSGATDCEWAPINEAAAMLLTPFSEAAQRQQSNTNASIRRLKQ
jgi:hypothetical protein